ncbi:NmrA family NAD(P)-binding protein [Kribbella sp. CA-293567]|uniref:NmrA family NAD(P)-binding protein n=1 Tax=Kribbella sp. CA-293567 TaxID=3002436 RepID=UPI0022DE67F1|nr:NAD(P)H-binding protein [Kribbella sp. CA-293567]WBQ06512.1 NAD(P)H-binding protein [Kribbella sp. CA-293567]
MTILVTGATGSVGRLLVDELVAAGVSSSVRALTNNPARAALPAGVQVAEGYLGRPSSLPAALKGVDTVYLAPLPARVDEFVTCALEAGVRRVVCLSGEPADYEAQGDPAGWHYYKMEKAIEEAGFEWTHLRPGQFMNNTLDWAPSIKAERVVRAPYPEAVQTPIDLGDIAAVARVVLLDESYAGQKLVMSGPDAITQPEEVALIAEAIGQPVRFEELSREEALAAWTPVMGEEVASWMLDGFRMMAEYRMSPEPTVLEVTGRAPLSYREWAVRNADAFR